MSTTVHNNNNNPAQPISDPQPPPLESVSDPPTSTSTPISTSAAPVISNYLPNGQPIKWIAIQTVQANCSLNVKVDLRAVASKARNAVYEPRQRSGAVVLQCKSPRATANVFNSGAMVLIGSGSELDMKISARKIARQIQLSLIQSSADITSAQLIISQLRFTGYRVNNVGGSGSIGYTIDLEKFSSSIEYGDDITYDPERFPGAQYKMLSPDVSTTIFYNGSITITGGKCENDIYVAYDKLYKLLIPFATSSIPHPSVQLQHLTHTLNKIHQMNRKDQINEFIIDPRTFMNHNNQKNKKMKVANDTINDNIDFDAIQWE